MRTKSEILELLKSQLGSAWNNNTGVLGKELLALGTEIIHQVDLVHQEIDYPINYDELSVHDLYRRCTAEGVLASTYRPASITVSVDSTLAVQNPYAISVNTGGTTYYNVTPQGGTLITLYAGLPQYISNGAPTAQVPYISSYTSATLDALGRVDLGTTVFPDSLQLFDTNAKSLPNFNIQNFYSASASYNRAYTDVDGHTYVEFTDATQFIFLDTAKSVAAFQVGSTVTVTVGSSSYSAEVIDSSDSSSSTDVLKNYLRLAASKTYVLNNKDLIESAITEYPMVHSCNVSFVPFNQSITNYIKPYIEGATPDYSVINDLIYSRGPLYAEVNTLSASPVLFSIDISGCSTSERATVLATLADILAYSNLDIKYTVNVGSLSAQVQSLTGISAYLAIRFTESIYSVNKVGKLSASPVPGTVEVYDASDNIVGVDHDGYFTALNMMRQTMHSFDSPGSSPMATFGFFTHHVAMQHKYPWWGAPWYSTTSLENKTCVLGSKYLHGPVDSDPYQSYDWSNTYNDDARSFISSSNLLAGRTWINAAVERAFSANSEASISIVELICASADHFPILLAKVTVSGVSGYSFRGIVCQGKDFWTYPETGSEYLHPLARFTMTQNQYLAFARTLSIGSLTSTSMSTYEKVQAALYGPTLANTYDVSETMSTTPGNISGCQNIAPNLVFDGQYLVHHTSSSVDFYSLGIATRTYADRSNPYKSYNARYTDFVTLDNAPVISQTFSTATSNLQGITFRNNTIFCMRNGVLFSFDRTCSGSAIPIPVTADGSSIDFSPTQSYHINGVSHYSQYPEIPKYQFISSSGNWAAVLLTVQENNSGRVLTQHIYMIDLYTQYVNTFLASGSAIDFVHHNITDLDAFSTLTGSPVDTWVTSTPASLIDVDGKGVFAFDLSAMCTASISGSNQYYALSRVGVALHVNDISSSAHTYNLIQLGSFGIKNKIKPEEFLTTHPAEEVGFVDYTTGDVQLPDSGVKVTYSTTSVISPSVNTYMKYDPI